MIRVLGPFALVLSLLLVAVALPAQRQQQEPPKTPQQGPTTLQVHVVFEDSHRAAERLQVDLTNGGGIPIAQGLTDGTGETMLQAPGGGSYVLKVSGTSIQKELTQSVEVNPCGEALCTQSVYVPVKAKAEAQATQSTAKGENAAVTSAAELRAPQSARKAFDQGMTAWQKKDYQQAAEMFEKAVADYPEYDSAYNNLGVMYAHLGQDDKAIAAFRRSVELNDKNADADRNLARMLMRQKNYSEAEELLKKSLSVEPTEAETLTMLVMAEVQDGKPDEALKDAQKVHALPHDGYSVVHYIAGEVLEQKHQYAEARAEYEMYLKETPNGPVAEQVKSALARLPSSAAVTTPSTR